MEILLENCQGRFDNFQTDPLTNMFSDIVFRVFFQAKILEEIHQMFRRCSIRTISPAVIKQFEIQ